MTVTVAPEAAERSTATPVLDVRNLTVHHGQLRALSDVSLAVPAGDVTAIIGANGAGKSTLLRTIAGLHRPTSGSILLDGRDITGERPEKRVTDGIALVPEGRRLFPSLTVEENLLVGATAAGRRHGGAWTLERVYGLFTWMPGRRKQHAWQLSGGEQQAVALGRALMSNPRVLLLDELSLGLSPRVVRQIYALMPQLLESGLTVLLVEQDVSQAVRVAARIQCLLEGRTSLQGRPGDFSPGEIEAAYFGLGDRGQQPQGPGASAEAGTTTEGGTATEAPATAPAGTANTPAGTANTPAGTPGTPDGTTGTTAAAPSASAETSQSPADTETTR